MLIDFEFLKTIIFHIYENIIMKTQTQKSFNKSKLENFKTTSAKIRYLNSKNYSRSEISNILKIRYQWVRNVLITEVKDFREKI